MRLSTALAGLVAAGLMAAGVATSAGAADYSRRPFGILPDGQPVEAITLTGGKVSAVILSLGASVQSVRTPDRTGHLDDIVLGYDTVAGYAAKGDFFGATVGRVANRIAKGTFTLDGRTYHVPTNDGQNALHGGPEGFDKRVWQVVSMERGPVARVTLRLVSADGDQGFPGTLTVTATYTLDDRGELSVDYQATTDRPTVVNLSNHTYWSLAGEGSPRGAMGLTLTLPAQAYTPVDATLIPTGEIRPVAGTPFDFRSSTAIGARVRDGQDVQLRYGRGYDHNWVVSRTTAPAPRLMARVEDPVSGRVLEVLAADPGIQFYSGNFLDATIAGKGGHLYRQGDAFVLEPQMFPDTPNHPAFGSIRLAPGETYRNHIAFRFSVAPGG